MILLGYIYLVLAIIIGCIINFYLKKSNGFTILFPTVVCIICNFILVILLAKMYVYLPMGLSFATYAASIILFATFIGIVLYNEKVSVYTITGTVLTIIGLTLLYIQ